MYIKQFSNQALVITFLLIILLLSLDYAIPRSLIFSETDSWWEVEKTTDFAFKAYESMKIYLRFADLDENKIHSCYEYAVLDSQNQTVEADSFCYPAIIVTGIRKSSTTALYHLLSKHPNALKLYTKENCPFTPRNTLIQFFETMPRYVEKNKFLIDGCIDMFGNMKIMEILHQPKTFYLVIIRDFADWVWSAYNFWCSRTYDSNCKNTVKAGFHLRSPELLHEIVSGAINGSNVQHPFSFRNPCQFGKRRYRNIIPRIWEKIKPNKTLVLASEELEKNPHKVWLRISTSIGLDATHPRISEFVKLRYNTQLETEKSLKSTTKAHQFRAGRYKSSQFRPLLNETRLLLNLCWLEDCRWASQVTGYQFSACTKNGLISSGEVTPSVSFTRRAAARYPQVVFTSELQRDIDEYLHRHFSSHDIVPFWSVIFHNPLCSLLTADRKAILAEKKATSLLNFNPGQVFLITTHVKDRNQIADLIMSFDPSICVIHVGKRSTDQLSDSTGFNLNTEQNKVKNSCNISGLFITIVSSEDIVPLSKKTKSLNSQRYYQLKTQFSSEKGYCINCEGHWLTEEAKFKLNSPSKKILLLLRDPLSSTWEAFRGLEERPVSPAGSVVRLYSRAEQLQVEDDKKGQTVHNGTQLVGPLSHQFNWQRWEDFLRKGLVERFERTNCSLKVFWEEQEILRSLDLFNSFCERDQDNLYITSIEGLFFSTLKSNKRRNLFNFLGVLMPDHNEYFYCSLLRSPIKLQSFRGFLDFRRSWELHNFEEPLLHKIERVYGSLQLDLRDTLLGYTGSRTIPLQNQPDRHKSLCLSRYPRRGVKAVRVDDPVGLLISPMFSLKHPYSPDVVSNEEEIKFLGLSAIRLLIERSTGIFTGSAFSSDFNKVTARDGDIMSKLKDALLRLFPNENTCHRRHSAIAVDSAEIGLVRLTGRTKSRNRWVLNSNNPTGIGKCAAGSIRGFSKIVYLIPDPILHVIHTQGRDLASKGGTIMGLLEGFFEEQVTNPLILLQNEKEVNVDVLVFSVASFFSAALDERGNNYTAMNKLLSLIGFDNTYHERIKCAHEFLDDDISDFKKVFQGFSNTSAARKDLNIFLEEICVVLNNWKKNSPLRIKSFVTLFDIESCTLL